MNLISNNLFFQESRDVSRIIRLYRNWFINCICYSIIDQIEYEIRVMRLTERCRKSSLWKGPDRVRRSPMSMRSCHAFADSRLSQWNSSSYYTSWSRASQEWRRRQQDMCRYQFERLTLLTYGLNETVMFSTFASRTNRWLLVSSQDLVVSSLSSSASNVESFSVSVLQLMKVHPSRVYAAFQQLHSESGFLAGTWCCFPGPTLLAFTLLAVESAWSRMDMCGVKWIALVQGLMPRIAPNQVSRSWLELQIPLRVQ